MPMRLVWVNECVEPRKAFCAYDHVELCHGYIRELATGLVYHDRCCLELNLLQCETVVNRANAS
jgi:hypothetical protein